MMCVCVSLYYVVFFQFQVLVPTVSIPQLPPLLQLAPVFHLVHVSSVAASQNQSNKKILPNRIRQTGLFPQMAQFQSVAKN